MIAVTNRLPSKFGRTQPELEFFRPLVNGWLGKIEAARESPQRKRWKAQADECMNFYSMNKKLHDLMGNDPNGSFSAIQKAPKFQMVIAKAFELVAQIGPSLFFNVPDRKVTPKTLKELPQEFFGDVENDPQAQQIYQAHIQERTSLDSERQSRATLLEHWLGYTPGEMPGGGLEEHAQRAIVEALIKGRGVLWAEPYTKAGSDVTLTGLWYDTVDNLYLDPDATKLEDVRWIAQRVVEHHRDAEDRFDLKRNSLKGRCSLESHWAEGERIRNDTAQMHGTNGTSKDMICYYKIWSKQGVGLEYTGGDEGVNEHLTDILGKHVYVVVSPTVPYPLNAPTAKVKEGATDDQVKDMFEWPIPYWTDNAWPVEFLDFYGEPNNIWPIPALSPAMPELKFMSIMMSHLCNRIWMSSRSFIAVAKSAMSEIEGIINQGADLSVLPVSDIHGGVEKMISFLKQPDVNLDAWTIVDRVAHSFDKNTGLTDLVYGMSNTQSRSAEDAAIKGQAIAVRPEYMANRVEKWMAQATRKEAFCTRWFVTAEDVAPLLGQVGAYLWQQLIDEQDVEKVILEMEYTIAAGSAKRRNRQEELANLNQALQFFFPELSKHADVTTDTSAVNALIQRWGDAAQIDLSDVVLGQRAPPPPEGPTPEQQEAQQEMQHEQEMHQLEMQTKAQEHQMGMQEQQAKIQEIMAKIQAQAMQAKIKQTGEQQKLQAKQRDDLMDMLMSRQQHQQVLQQDEQKHDQELELLEEKADVELDIAKEKAAAQIQAAKQQAAVQRQNAAKTPSKGE
jgi:hypothetical protein